MMTKKIESFGRLCSARVVTSFRLGGEAYEVVKARNPYGTHNLLLCHADDGHAFRHGNCAVLDFLAQWGLWKPFSRAMRAVPSCRFELVSAEGAA